MAYTRTTEHKQQMSELKQEFYTDPKEREAQSTRRKAWWARANRGWRGKCTEAEYSRWKRYRITPDQFAQLWHDQDGKCKICPKPLRKGAGGCAVDHDHNTHIVRGLLCASCNGSLGWFELNKEQIMKYLACPGMCA